LKNGVFDFLPSLSWDGTSMAAPHVAGAAALYWSRNPTKTWKEVKNAILQNTQSLPALAGKVASGGKLDVRNLINH
jgi:subtilisin family serine protease